MPLARCTLAGVLTHEPEERFTQNNVAVTTLMLEVPNLAKTGAKGATGEPGTLKVVCWRNMATVAKTLSRGQAVLVEGKLTLQPIQSTDGVQRKQVELEAQQISKLPALPELLQPAAVAPTSGGYASAPAGNGYQQPAATTPVAPVATNDLSPDDFLTEDDIPF